MCIHTRVHIHAYTHTHTYVYIQVLRMTQELLSMRQENEELIREIQSLEAQAKERAGALEESRQENQLIKVLRAA
jgi:hypothetical protein